jgi:hypothetical protein
MSGLEWSAEMVEHLRFHFLAGGTVNEFARDWGMTPARVHWKVWKLKLMHPDQRVKSGGIDRDNYTPAEVKKMNAAFCHAMRFAIAMGTERPHIGVITAPPHNWGVIRVTPAFGHRHTQSIAGECADLGRAAG